MHGQRDPRRLVRGGVDGSVGDARRGLDRLEIPLSVALVELIMGVDAQQLVVQAALRNCRAVGRGDDDIEAGVGAVGKRAAGEQRFDADHVAARRHRQNQRVLDCAAAGLGHAHGDLRLQRMGGRGQLVETDGKFRFAGRVGRRQAVERLLHRFDLFIGEAELIAGKAGALRRHRDRHIAVKIEARSRRAIEEAAGDVDFGRAVRRMLFAGELRSNSIRSGT